ncbi:hypothetical protein [Dickeya oryzae]|uniref:hypothetical protein n=1 Tax=Dickeya oryzae TaxID=1240404 RepID=UPI001AED0D74|nr:hypothetical protein [Dickeya oryzae]MBP2851797.1 hypothetical protein [Dickeya oryzae]MCO7254745.1 hypothetical protein [Dickeya oryzae]
MVSRDDELYSEIGRILYESAPEDAQIILLDAELSPEDDHAKFLYDYVNNEGEKAWFLPDEPSIDRLLLDKLVELRKFYVANNLTNGLPGWHGCVVTVNLEKMKIDLQYRYD